MFGAFERLVALRYLAARKGERFVSFNAWFSLIGIAIIFALSYNILLGQTGLLSFGHAVQYGLGGFLAVHAMNAVASHNWPIPLPVIPLVGGIGGIFVYVGAGGKNRFVMFAFIGTVVTAAHGDGLVGIL